MLIYSIHYLLICDYNKIMFRKER